ncbi:MAG: VOC family protein [Dehalococcoidia bacterium]
MERVGQSGDRAPDDALIRKVDAVRIPVPDLDAGLAFYRDRLGHTLRWRTQTSIGLAMPDSDTEIVLQTERPGLETDLLVSSADTAVQAFIEAGGSVIAGPFDIPVGRVLVVADPWGNQLVLLDLSKGTYQTDAAGNVTGVSGGEGA